MALSRLPLSYCTNVHPGRTLDEVNQGLDHYTAALRERYAAPLAAGLWLAAPVVAELLAQPDRLPAFREGLAHRRLTCHTLNAFPYGDFHGESVKGNVYLPDWADLRRLQYTVDCAHVLATLLPENVEGSISTLPLAGKSGNDSDRFLNLCIAQLLTAATVLAQLHEQTGRLIRLAIEPEPCCLIETTDEAIDFFNRLWDQAADCRQLENAQRHLGLCYDVCHQAVEFEDIPGSISRLDEAGVRINKVHITCALELESPGKNEAGRRALAGYAEKRYLHQTLARTRTGRIVREYDLSEQFALDPPGEFREAEAWRIHFHVPVDAERLGPLRTTRRELREALAAVDELDYAPHLEVETYTWEVLPGERPSSLNLIDGLAAELVATRNMLAEISRK